MSHLDSATAAPEMNISEINLVPKLVHRKVSAM